MTTSSITAGTDNIPDQVFKTFLESIEGAGVPIELVARLRKTLLEDHVFSDAALKSAVLGEEPAQ